LGKCGFEVVYSAIEGILSIKIHWLDGLK